jgi:CheY-like chemotaxis protein
MKRILVIEKYPLYRAEICRLLRFEKYQVIQAENGIEGLNLAREKHPDLILCDVETPGLDGYKVLESLRADSTVSKIPFVFLAGSIDPGSHSHAMNLGASAYLSKLASPSELLRVIATKLK